MGFKNWFSHWFSSSGGKVLSGILIGTGVLFMIWASCLHKSNIVFVMGIAFVMIGVLVFLTEKGKDRRKWPHW
jgi:hypothetical protein